MSPVSKLTVTQAEDTKIRVEMTPVPTNKGLVPTLGAVRKGENQTITMEPAR